MFIPSSPGVAARAEEISCWAHARRPFFELYKAVKSPLAKEALERIGALYQIEDYIRGCSPEFRRTSRQKYAVPLLDAGGALWSTRCRRLGAWLPDLVWLTESMPCDMVSS